MNNLQSRKPLISVIMPVYNGERFLVAAIASIIEQSQSDWELVCVNDGSTDRSSELLEWFAEQDGRIRVIQQKNSGIVAALNAGCAVARAPLICRMDCDDVCMLDRFEKQVEFMRRNPTCTVVGGAILEIDADSDPLGVSRLPAGHADIVDNLLHRRPGHFHPTTLIRAEALEAAGGYRAKYQWVEDHDLWLRLAQRGRLANLTDCLLAYRQHASSVCWQRTTQQRQLMNELLNEAYAVRGLQVPADVLLTADFSRSSAGPGKWARMAARGGHARTTWKHLSVLNRSDATSSYKARMSLETTLRLTISLIKNYLTKKSPAKVPTFPAWEQRACDRFKTAPSTPRARPGAAA